MGFFEKFNKIEPSKKGMVKDDKFTEMAIKDQDSFGIKKEESLDHFVHEINQSLKVKEVIYGEDPMELDQQDKNTLENLLLLKGVAYEIHQDNIRLLMSEIDANNKKIKQLEDSLEITEREDTTMSQETRTISLKSFQKMIGSLDKLNTEKEIQIKEEEVKIKNIFNEDFYNQN